MTADNINEKEGEAEFPSNASSPSDLQLHGDGDASSQTSDPTLDPSPEQPPGVPAHQPHPVPSESILDEAAKGQDGIRVAGSPTRNDDDKELDVPPQLPSGGIAPEAVGLSSVEAAPDSVSVCDSCGSPVERQDLFCVSCGRALRAMPSSPQLDDGAARSKQAPTSPQSGWGLLGSTRRFLRKAPITTLVLALAVGAGTAGISATAAQRRADKLEMRLDRANGDLAKARSDITAAQAQIEQLNAKNGLLQDRVKKMQARVPLPSFVGQTLDRARTVIADHGWRLMRKSLRSPRAEGTVLAQSPPPGTTMKFGGIVTLTVAVPVPPLPPGWKTIYTFSGAGKYNTPLLHLPDVESGTLRISYRFRGDTNAQITLYQPPDDYVENYLNEIGNYYGSTFVYYSGDYYLQICCGSWSVKVQVYR